MRSVLLPVFVVALLFAGTGLTPEPAGGGPVVVELFTSQGCSSCPPADTVLRGLHAARSLDGVRVLVLSEHVDYWNRLGWRDPYSSATFSKRQEAYARAQGRANIYTPQMVVNGRYEFVGHDLDTARARIAEAARQRGVRLRVFAPGVKPGQSVFGEGDKNVKVRVELHEAYASPGDGLEVYVALLEDGLGQKVPRGENAGRTLTHDAVVRSLKRVGTIAYAANPPPRQLTRFDAELPLAAEWRRSKLRWVAFVQAQRSRHILGAAE